MAAKNIGVGVHYMSIPEHPYYQKTFGWNPVHYPHAMRIGRQTVSLPISVNLTDDDLEEVIEAVMDTCSSRKREGKLSTKPRGKRR
jgi:dTDP-4-amino-4,6-dideoxygalactose transaminase